MTFATLTSKGQITLPKEVRTRLNLQAGDRLEFIWVGDELRVRPASRKVDEVFGKFRRPQQPVLSVEEMNTAIQKRIQSDAS